MRVFKVVRKQDESGVSGISRVLDGVVFDDGTTVIRWRTKMASTAIYRTFNEFYDIHIASHPVNETITEIQEIMWDDKMVELFDPDELQHKDELDEAWVKEWRSILF